MLEALWTVHFHANTGQYGGGVVIFETGRVLGGDSDYAYVGHFTYKTGKPLDVTLTVSNHSGRRHSVFGDRETFTLKLSGEPEHDGFDLTGHLEDDPDMRIAIRLERFEELPDTQ